MPKAKPSTKRPAAEQAPEWPRFKPPLPVAELAPQLHPDTPKIALVPYFFPRSLCRDFVAFFRTLPLQTTPARPKRGEAARVNDRFQVDDAVFARRLWEQTGLKEALTEDDNDDDNNVELATDPPTPARTTWTLLLYLTSTSEGCVGGETVFYLHDRKSSAEAIVVPPETGLLLLHKHGDDCLLLLRPRRDDGYLPLDMRP
ncbi:hypothetical protein CP533_6267 [Ophiocordyceps camponoti-saundersi (nom. inval.)]|nr:hypothetical protein CP533_6267 [Ophiocordyceps camponoti-saundersi (nom. inval.)]